MPLPFLRRLLGALLLLLTLTGSVRAQSTDLALAKEYARKEDWAKAAATFQGLPADVREGALAYPDYLRTLLALKLYKDAEKLVRRTTRHAPALTGAGVDLGTVLTAAGDEPAARKHYEKLLQGLSAPLVEPAATAFRLHRLPEYAERAYLRGRQLAGSDAAYATQLLELYSQTNQPQKTVEEVLRLVGREPTRLPEAQNLLQNVLHDDKDFEALEKTLLTEAQRNPDRPAAPELLVWLYTQRKDFFAALIQAKALDQRENREGARLIDLAQIAFENKDFQSAIDAYDYVRTTYPRGQYYTFARQRAINAREAQVRGAFPVDPAKIRALLTEYDGLLTELGRTPATAGVLRDEALLYAFQLGEKDKALALLNEVNRMPRVEPRLAAEAKLALADIYLLKGEPWEATLLYSQVEHDRKETPEGFEAKLRNARLSYFRGEFALAQDHLDILKMATTREIANDAMALSLLITDNTGLDLDTTNAALRRYSSVELLVFQNRLPQAVARLDSLMKQFPGHSLTDDSQYLKAKLLARMLDYKGAVASLNLIVQNPKYDVLADDALFLLAQLEEENLQTPAQAMEHYNQLLTKYPGSIFAADARRRYRRLRGDNLGG